MRKNVCVGLLSLLWLSVLASYGDGSPGRGFYSGFISQYSALEPTNRIAAVTFTINNGEVRGSLGHTGLVTSEGTIEFRDGPSAYPFTTGILTTNGTLRALTVVSNAMGANSTLLLEAHATDPAFSEDRSLYGRLTVLQPRGGVKEMNRVRYSDGEFLAAGPSGTFATSDNGLDWFRAGIPAASELYDIGKSGNTYVAVGLEGYAFTSTNLVSWAKTSLSTNSVASIAVGNNTWVAVDQLGYVYTSPNGFDWSARPPPIPQQTNAIRRSPFPTAEPPPARVEFVNNHFLLWATNFVTFSTNGTKWSEPTPVDIRMNSGYDQATPIAFGNGRYLLAGLSKVAVSTNGIDWQFGTNRGEVTPRPVSDLSLPAVAFGSDRFVGLGSGGRDIYSSVNGLEWTLAREGALSQARSLAFGEQRFVAVGKSSSHSIDGLVWPALDVDMFSPPSVPPWMVRTGTNTITTSWHQVREGFYAANPWQGPQEEANVNAFVEIGDTHLWVGNSGYIYSYQTNAIPRYGVLPPVTTNDFLAAAVDPASRTAFLAGTRGTIVRVDWSANGPLLSIPPRVTTNTIHAIAYHPPFIGFPGAFIFGGEQGIILSSFGPNYDSFVKIASPTTETLRAAFTPNYFETPATGFMLLGGDRGVILRSTNARDWVAATTGTDGDFTSFFVRYPTLQATQHEGSTFVSEDGLSWTRIANSDLPPRSPAEIREPGHIKGMTLGSGLWVVAGHGYLTSSEDLLSWRHIRKRATYEDVAFGNGTFVAVGVNGRIDVSRDGVSWTTTREAVGIIAMPGPPTFSVASGGHPREATLRAVAFGSNKFVVVGHLGVVLVSPDGTNWTQKELSSSFVDVEYHDGLFVAVGGAIAAASNDGGESWTLTTPPMRADSITWGNGRFVTVADSGQVNESTNGVVWTGRQLPFPPFGSRPRFRAVVAANDQFFATTYNPHIIYQTFDAVTWTPIYTGINRHFSGDLAGSALFSKNGLLVIAAGRDLFSIGLEDVSSPILNTHPSSVTAEAGSTVTLNSQATTEVAYRWLKNGIQLSNSTTISGIETPNLILTDVRRTDSGNYVVAISNDAGSRRSRVARVTVTPPPGASLSRWMHFQNITNVHSDIDADAFSNVAEYASGTDPLIPEWETTPVPLLLQIGGNVHPAVQFTRNKTAAGARLEVTASTAPNGGNPLQTTQTVEDAGSGLERVTARTVDPLQNFTKVFFHLQVRVE